MYKERLHFSKLPFENVPDPDFFYDSGDFSRIFENLNNSLQAGRGLMVVTGAIGSGKTTLSQMVMNKFGQGLKLIWMAEPPENGMDVLLFIAREIGLSSSYDNRVFLLNDIRSTLLGYEVPCLLILDEAHLMSDEVVNTIKALNNLELMSKKLIQMILLGQDELLEIINRPEMLPFKQRIALLEIIGRMERSEVRDYIHFRLKAAGGNPDTFTEDAIEAIAIGSGSVPRVINSLCDKALYHAASKNSQIADVEDVYDAAQEMVDRKKIFQFMLSVRNRPGGDDEKPGSTMPGEFTDSAEAPQVSATNAHPPAAFEDWAGRAVDGDGRHHPDILFSSGELVVDINTAEGQSDQGATGLGLPLIHLVLSSIALAASLYFFSESSGIVLDDLFETLWKLLGTL